MRTPVVLLTALIAGAVAVSAQGPWVSPPSTNGHLVVKGLEAGDAVLTLSADEGDDAADTWHLKSLATDNTVSLMHDTLSVVQANNTARNTLILVAGAFGTGTASGATLSVGHNTSGSGAAGNIALVARSGTAAYVWVDGSGNVRINAAPPTENNSTVADTGGTVVGAQSSSLDSKILLGTSVSPRQALDTMLRTPVRQFVYRNGAYNGTKFTGIVADWSPEFAMDPDQAHPNGRSFNPVNGFGYTVQAIKELESQIDALRAEVAALRREKGDAVR